jgi:hypothetical protein
MKIEDINCSEDADLYAKIKAAEALLEIAVNYADRHGLIVRIEGTPAWPLYMGNVKHAYDVRPNLANARAKMERDKLRKEREHVARTEG